MTVTAMAGLPQPVLTDRAGLPHETDTRAGSRTSSDPADPPGGEEGERRYRLAWPPWQPPGAHGLAAVVTPDAAIGWADSLLAREDGRLVVWAATGADPEAEGLARLSYPGVRAMTLAPARADPRQVRLGLEVAGQLPGTDGRHPAARLTSGTSPHTPAGVVKIPHLVTVVRDGGGTDRVVWELAPLAVAQHWLGGPLPEPECLAFFERHLTALLRLRGALRRGQAPAAALAAGLIGLLPGRELTIRQVYRYPDRFRGFLGGRG